MRLGPEDELHLRFLSGHGIRGNHGKGDDFQL